MLSSGANFIFSLEALYDKYLQEHVALILLFSLSVYFLLIKFDHYLYRIPGPFLAGFTGLWKLWDAFKGSSQYTGQT
jgi:hypothetical protein